MRHVEAIIARVLLAASLLGLGIVLGSFGQADHLFEGQQRAAEVIAQWDWPVITSVLLAVATALLAFFTWRATRHGQAAVAAARQAIGESRREAVLGATPFLAPTRPKAFLEGGDLHFLFEATNLGPGHALQIGFDVDAQEREGDPFLAVKAHSIASGILATGDTLRLVGGAQDLQDRTVTWPEDEYGQRPAPPRGIFRPIRLRVGLTWLSTRGGRARLTYIWDTRDVAGRESDAWRFESLSMDPGEGWGERLVVSPTDHPF